MTMTQTHEPAVIAFLHQAELAETGRENVPTVDQIADEWRKHPEARFIVARDDLPFGFLAYQPLPDGGLYVSDLYVVPARRREGWGRKLLTELMRTGKTLELAVAADNHPARSLYRSCGFLECQGNVPSRMIRMRYGTGSDTP